VHAQVALTVDLDARLYAVDLRSGQILQDVPVTAPGFAAVWTTGLARDPESGKVFILISTSASVNPPRLMTLDPCTGVATDIGRPRFFLEFLAFDGVGELWGVSDWLDFVHPESLFRVNKDDATATFATHLGGKRGVGEAIAYNPYDGQLYRISGWDETERIFESIELETLTGQKIPISGDDFIRPEGMGHVSGNSFLLTEPTVVGGRVWRVTGDGSVEFVTFLNHGPWGIVVVEGTEGGETTLVVVDRNEARLRRVAAENGRTLWCVPITMSGWNVTGATGVAQDPSGGALYALLSVSEIATSQLATVDTLTGQATYIGDTRGRLEDLAFVVGAGGSTLYGVSGEDDAVSPEWLFTIDLGDATLTPVMALGDGTDGESIAFHPLDGSIYHASGIGVADVDRVFERVDLSAGTVTDVPLSGTPYTEATGMAYLTSGDLVLADSADRLYTITQSGEVTFLADLDTSVSGLVLLRRGVGENVCFSTANSTGAPASMSAFGSDRARPGDGLTLTGEPVPDQTGLFFFGPTERQVPFGQGYLCVGGGVTRVLPPVRASGHTVSVAVLGSGFVPGETTYFQYWFRDPAAGGAAFNTSDALRVTFKF